MRGAAGRRRTRSLRCSPAPRRAQLGPGAALQHLGEAASEAWRRRRDVAPLAVRGCSGALRKSVQPESSPRSARARPLRASASCPPSPRWARAMPRRGGPVQHCPPRCVFAFPLCCLLIDRVAAVRSVDFAAEEGVVAPPGGAPGTPAGCCWLLDMSLRRMARSGWTCDLGDDHDDLRDVQGLS